MQQSPLGSSFLYKFTKSASFYNAKPILTKLNALLAIKFPGCQCQATRMTPFFFLDPSGLCCIASYDGLKIKKMENISSLLFWYL
ncbi:MULTISPECIES: hypothetical protein [unclassified Wolbachia]|uniref:hypothetical protein n=2 Tax=Wolbachia TaxID=953 RepID=UPI0001988CF3|nr:MULTISPECIES: hypothetical protein [Wolbachia]EEH12172.1 hypothetical protein WUni_004820 [Wolbachia endosymbiont of Muscidifurax uniraptor]UJQ21171.1 hypothetical protein L2227_00880 [Wolbachia endosymbiont of Delia radicum]